MTTSVYITPDTRGEINEFGFAIIDETMPKTSHVPSIRILAPLFLKTSVQIYRLLEVSCKVSQSR